MTLTEILQSQGLTPEQIEKITGEMKQNKIFTAAEENLDIRYGKLKTEHEGTTAELEKANGLIAELQKASKGNEEMQGKITAYETEVSQLQEELKRTKIDAAIKVALLAAKATDVGYLTYRLREKGDALELDKDGNVKGIDDKIAALKTQCPLQFEQSSGGKKVDPNKLPDNDGERKPAEPKNLAEALEQAYEAPKD